jgi:hypothetical protein
VGTEDEMWFSQAEKQVLKLGVACETVLPGVNTTAVANASATAIDLRVYLTDFNMELLPITSIASVNATSEAIDFPSESAGCCTITTEVEAIYKMGRTPGYCDVSQNATGDHYCYPAHFLENIPGAIAGPSEWAVDTNAGLLYYWPSYANEAGEPVLDAVWVGSNSELIRVEGGGAALRETRPSTPGRPSKNHSSGNSNPLVQLEEMSVHVS